MEMGVPLDKKTMAYITPLPNGTTTYKLLTSLLEMTTNLWHVFLMEKNTNNKVTRWSLELATYNISFELISGARNKVADCLSRLVTPTSTSVTC